MSKIKFVLVIFIGAFALLSFSFIKSTQKSEGVTLDAKRLFAQFYGKAHLLTQISEAFQVKKVAPSALENALSEARLAYKKVEFLIEYYYPSFVEEHINGAPLYHAEKYSTHSLVKPPEGLQVLDEMIFSEELSDQRAEIAILCRTLENKILELEADFINKSYSLEELIEASRMELIRIFSMGVTGFDTPGSANALPEAASSIQSILEVLEKTGKLNEATLELFKTAIQYLNSNNNFDNFDRLFFLKEFINPLYAKLGKLQEELGLNAVVQFPNGRNPKSKNLFNQDFLNPYFYTELTKEEDNLDLKSLGEALFYDKRLSKNQDLSCASCHRPELAFSDGLKKSQSNIKGKTVLRNSPTLLNAVYADRYFYDMRAFTLEQQAEHVIFDAAEFNTEYESILRTLASNPNYVIHFEKAFGNQEISRDRFSKALASYVLSLQSFNSSFDRYVRNEGQELSDVAKLGFNLFMGKAACATCHFPPTFSGLMPPYFSKNESEILGVLTSPYSLKKQIDSDPGRINNGLHYEEAWIYEKSFKTPTVRNSEKTAPYFHNGAYPSLELVVEFYNHGGGAGLGLDVKNQTLAADVLNLSKEEKIALIEFMKSLTELN